MENLSGMVFGPLTVIQPSETNGRWLCKCECGKHWNILKGNLLITRSKRCTCVMREARTQSATTHGLARTTEYRVWANMRTRCNNPKAKSYSRYGGRGILCDPRWNDFEVFLRDMGPRPSTEHTLERKDNDGSYSLENCVWADWATQNNNKRSNKRITFDGRTQNSSQWAREIGLLPDALSQRLTILGWSVEKALTTPHRGWYPGSKSKS